MTQEIKLIECPRDAMQGIKPFIPTQLKIDYLNTLLQVGFDTLDFGSFVSPKAIPQMADTLAVLDGLDLSNTSTKLLAIVANLRGVEEAIKHKPIQYLGFPFSISETFQQRNTNASMADAVSIIEEMLQLCAKHGKTAVIYLSMGFGNPYGDEWNAEIVEQWTSLLVQKGVEIISIADTIGISTPENIKLILPKLIQQFNKTEIGIHLHATPQQRVEKIEAAYQAGVMRIDSAIKGFGGCPMATDSLTGNIATEDLIDYLASKKINLKLCTEKWHDALLLANRVFG